MQTTLLHAVHPADYPCYSTEQLRERFLVGDLFEGAAPRFAYSLEDRLLLGGVIPKSEVRLDHIPELGCGFSEGREAAFLNIGAPGEVEVDGVRHEVAHESLVYVGRGAGEITLRSVGNGQPEFLVASSPAHRPFPTTLVRNSEAVTVELGSKEQCNERVIYKYIAPGCPVESCQLMMGITKLEAGSVWNTMPAHTHLRRMEAYFYYGQDDGNAVVHLMGTPQQTRSLIVRNRQAVISPPWSIHSGVGTSRYNFAWVMLGENQDFADMQAVSMADLL